MIALFTAGLTAFYMFRLYFVTFKGKSRMAPEVESHVHRPSSWMRVPLIVLAFLSIIGGFVGVPLVPGGDRIGDFLSESVGAPGGEASGHAAVSDGSFASTAP